MSVNRKVTVPVGRMDALRMSAWCALVDVDDGEA